MSAIGTKRTSLFASHMSAFGGKADMVIIQYVEHAEGHGERMFAAVCDLGLEGIVSKKLDAPYRSGPSKSWIKVKNPKAAAATRVLDGAF